MHTRKWSSLIRKAILATLLTFLCLEIFSRLGVATCRLIYRLNPGWASQALVYGWAYRRINPPAHAIPDKLDPNERLVVCLGGSTTQGISGMDWEGRNYINATSWADALQHRLNELPKYQNVRVLNLAKTSMISNYHIQVIQQLAQKGIKPQVVIWAAGLNDGAVLIESPRRFHESGDFLSVMDDNPQLFSTNQFLPLHVRLDAFLERYCFVYHLMGRFVRSSVKTTEQNVLQVHAQYAEIALKNYRANLQKLLHWATESHTRIILTSDPLPNTAENRTGGGTPYSNLKAPATFIFQASKTFAEEHQLTFADVATHIEGLKEDPKIYLLDHVHYTPYGNEKIADYLLPVLIKELDAASH